MSSVTRRCDCCLRTLKSCVRRSRCCRRRSIRRTSCGTRIVSCRHRNSCRSCARKSACCCRRSWMSCGRMSCGCCICRPPCGCSWSFGSRRRGRSGCIRRTTNVWRSSAWNRRRCSCRHQKSCGRWSIAMSSRGGCHGFRCPNRNSSCWLWTSRGSNSRRSDTPSSRHNIRSSRCTMGRTRGHTSWRRIPPSRSSTPSRRCASARLIARASRIRRKTTGRTTNTKRPSRCQRLR